MKQIYTRTYDSLSLKFVTNHVEEFIEKNSTIISVSYFTTGIFKIRYHAVIHFERK